MIRSRATWARKRLAIRGATLLMAIGPAACDRLMAPNTPPSVTIAAEGAALRTSPTGERYYLARDGVRFDGFATDPDEDITTVELFLNDQEYQRGTPVIEPGFHVILARCTDRAGNESTAGPSTSCQNRKGMG